MAALHIIASIQLKFSQTCAASVPHKPPEMARAMESGRTALSPDLHAVFIDVVGKSGTYQLRVNSWAARRAWNISDNKLLRHDFDWRHLFK